MAGIVLNTHARALQRAVDNIDISKKSEIIALLLNDFEAGARDWLWETGPDHGLAYGAERFAELLGDRSRDLRGRTLGDVAGAPEDNAGWIALAEAMAGHKQIESLELEIPGEDGGRWWQFAARPLFGRDGSFRGYRGVGRDVTAQRQTQEKLIQAKAAADAANAAKTQFLAVMSHELKTPLNAIVGFSELLANAQNGSLGPETSRDYATTVLSGARHLQAVINDILDATRIERGTMTLVEQEADAAELAEVALKMCREQAEQADVVMLAKLIDGIAIHGDMTRLKQVFLNILTNAIKFSPAGSYVNISFQKTDVGGLSLTVRDSGIGIKAEDLERVFEPFVQADEGSARHFGGIGLGLSIARKIARLHGGDVTLDSEPGAGTTAQLILPPARVTWPTPRSSTKSVAA
jgi:signal transduction histidine kinase